ncbi:hypothetical protein BU23DRAFT_487305 [Bimuria novae-zelandiae CBS 107.79]|uniref:tRNA(Phe) 7-[(3-amino-3-carboxypropyl)-4-demethylwyosine(37)-N(4)]-methyltransferase n=1 Tax=Bimuria novae-zelandiae CBS 107.79 TaxID=1447943 RepID=A0A6A5UR41_9PLEO|nr:hypothetical protein BU23DRAFT_487305 [Bimuria novae-zelandiae CBS 107.79]
MLPRFQMRKRKILAQLAAPDEEYHDLSPKGSIDAPIRDLIEDINGLDGLVTTSSCSGRISVFLEGRRADAYETAPEDTSLAGPGGKGGGGAWLYLSHDPIATSKDVSSDFMTLFGLKRGPPLDGRGTSSCRYIHLKFEPMILHILTSSLEDCQRVLTPALGAGFRESGAVSLTPSKTGELNPMVAVRSTGYSYDAVIGYHNDSEGNIALVDENYLKTLVNLANERFHINTERIARFRSALLHQYQAQAVRSSSLSVPEWEDAKARKRRKREEGLARQQALKAQGVSNRESSKAETSSDGHLNGMFD